MDGPAPAEMYQGGLYFDLAVDRIKIFFVCRFFKNFAQFFILLLGVSQVLNEPITSYSQGCRASFLQPNRLLQRIG